MFFDLLFNEKAEEKTLGLRIKIPKSEKKA